MSFIPHMPCEWCERKDAEINRQSVRLVELQDKLSTILEIARDAEKSGYPEDYTSAVARIKDLL